MAEATAVRELQELFEVLKEASEKAGYGDDVDEAEECRAVDALEAMGKISISTDILMKAQVAKPLRKFTKHRNQTVSAAVDKLLSSWKKLVSTEVAPKDGKVSPVKAASAVTKSSPAKGGGTERNASKRPENGGGKGGGGKSEPKVLPLVNDVGRDNFRKTVLEALQMVVKEAQGDDLEKAKECNAIAITVAIETELNKQLGGGKSSTEYKAKYRSLLFNLKDAKNPDLRRRVLLGEVEPERVIKMSSDDMASDNRKMENYLIKQKMIKEAERGQLATASTDQFKCAKCQHRKTVYFQMQTRSADEPMTTFVTCVNCNNRWKFC
eukprot:TRINITY_DN962_c0_g1_i2.p1 TRINITY_DN962_c0_g1~~TRINITY_DN962_c0_g1_i2.p1  ORF type:complete len:346 (-),score=101.93 TRINITY_DN962_c0_g1_i2:129-1100(-)